MRWRVQPARKSNGCSAMKGSPKTRPLANSMNPCSGFTLRWLRSREMFVPLTHAAGTAQADFGEALVIVGGEEQKAHYFVIDLPHSDDCFVMAFPAETTEAFLGKATFGPSPTSAVFPARFCTTTRSWR